MIRVAPIEDMELVRDTLMNPSVWSAFADDGCDSNFAPVQTAHNWFLGAWDGDEFLGMFLTSQINAVVCETHVAMLPNCGGRRAVVAGERLKEWIWLNTPFLRITTSAPSCNKLGLKFARLAGLSEFGLNPGSWLKNGQLHDLHLLGVSYGKSLGRSNNQR